HAGVLEVALAQPEVAQRLDELVVDLAGGDDPQPRARSGEADRVELVERGVLARYLQARAEQRALELHRRRREQVARRLVHAGALRQDGHDALAPDLGGAGGVGDVGDDLQRAPQAARARAGDRVR